MKISSILFLFCILFSNVSFANSCFSIFASEKFESSNEFTEAAKSWLGETVQGQTYGKDGVKQLYISNLRLQLLEKDNQVFAAVALVGKNLQRGVAIVSPDGTVKFVIPELTIKFKSEVSDFVVVQRILELISAYPSAAKVLDLVYDGLYVMKRNPDFLEIYKGLAEIKEIKNIYIPPQRSVFEKNFSPVQIND